MTYPVALRKGGVDRNILKTKTVDAEYTSPSARGAWIEIPPWRCPWETNGKVALRKGGVDRNRKHRVQRQLSTSRPPQGGRG